jgi:hypothetical protein
VKSPDPYALEDIWLNALGAFPDVRPLADLLRSDLPLPSTIRTVMAGLLDPGDPPIDRYVLRPEINPKFDDLINTTLPIVATSVAEEAEATGDTADDELTRHLRQEDRQSRGERQTYRHKAITKGVGARLRGKDTAKGRRKKRRGKGSSDH